MAVAGVGFCKKLNFGKNKTENQNMFLHCRGTMVCNVNKNNTCCTIDAFVS